MRSPKHTKTQEMWIGAHFGLSFEKHFGPCAILISDEDQQTDVDFVLVKDGNEYPFQTTERLTAGRRRGDEYRNHQPRRTYTHEPSRGAEQASEWIREAIENKCSKQYSGANKLNLLIYANFDAYEMQYDQIRAECEEVSNHFASVWILNGNCTCCIHSTHELKGPDAWMFIEESPSI